MTENELEMAHPPTSPSPDRGVPLEVNKPMYQIEQELHWALEEVAELDGELTPEMEDKLDDLYKLFKKKGNQVLYVIQSYDTKVAQIKEEIDRLGKLKVSLENKKSRIENIIKQPIKSFGTFKETATGIKKWTMDFVTHKVTLEEKYKTEIVDETKLPDSIKFTEYKLQSDVKLPEELISKVRSTKQEVSKTLFNDYIETLRKDIKATRSLLDMEDGNQLDMFTSAPTNAMQEELIAKLKELEEIETGIKDVLVQTIKTK